MPCSETAHRCAIAKIVAIDSVKKDLSHRSAHETRAFVEFTDDNGKPASGSFTICQSPLYTTLRIGHTIEIEYWEQSLLGGYAIKLRNPERYERIPTEEELAPYKRSNQRVLKQSLLSVCFAFLFLVLYGITRNFLFLIALIAMIFPIMKYGSEQSRKDRDKFMTWTSQDEN